MVSKVVDTCEVWLWGHQVGAAFWDPEQKLAVFEYAPVFQKSGIELAPLMMPLGPRIYRFPELRRSSFRGLPGLLADSLPDDFGNAIIDQWLIREGRDQQSFSPIERLCYIGFARQRVAVCLWISMPLPSLRNTYWICARA